MKSRLLATIFAGVVWLLLAAPGLGATPPANLPCDVPYGWSLVQGPGIPPEFQGPYGQRGVISLAVNWQDARRIVVAVNYGLYLSPDCGMTWTSISDRNGRGSASRPFASVAYHADGRLLASTAVGLFDPLFVGPDDGSDWRTVLIGGDRSFVSPGQMVASAAGRVYAQRAAPARANTIYQLVFSDDAGETWSVLPNVQIRSGYAVDPTAPHVLYSIQWLGGQQVRPGPTPGIPQDRLTKSPPYEFVRSVDSGASFQPWSQAEELPGALAVSADRSRFWFASYSQHLWQSRDDGQSWQIMDTMPFTDPKQLVVSPHDPHIVYAVSGDGHIWVYREPGAAPIQIPGVLP